MHGNTSVHQAASNGHDDVLKCFLAFGTDVRRANARLHTPLDLATKASTRALLQKALNTLKCKGSTCGHIVFDFVNIQYFCDTCQDFFCSKCSTKSWVYEHQKAQTKERPVCRCDSCANIIQKYENELQNAINAHEFSIVSNIVAEIKENNIDIDVQMSEEATILERKLDQEL